MLQPREVCARLGVKPSTLRRWSAQFGAWLSPTAASAITEVGGSQQRRYSEADLALLAAVQRALGRGVTVAELKQRLDAGDVVSPATPAPLVFASGERTTALTPAHGREIAPVSDIPAGMGVVVGDAFASRETVARLEAKLDEQNQLLREIRDALLARPGPVLNGHGPRSLLDRLRGR